MGFNRYILNITIRSILIAGTALIMVIFALNSDWIFTFIFFCFLFILQIFLLIRYVGKVNTDLSHFLIHLKEQNTSLHFSKNKLDKLFGGLIKEFDKINEEFKKIEDDKIKSQHLLNLLLQKVGTGILALNQNNEVKIYNQAILKLLGVEESSTQNELRTRALNLLIECKQLQVGEQQISTIHVNNITRKILIALSEIKEEGAILKIYSFHDIDREITDYELQSWNGLIKVLSHEIMNTLTPMSTSIDTLKDCMTINGKEKTQLQFDEKDIHDTLRGINLLDNCIHRLQNFIKQFRNFVDIPAPEIKEINVLDLFHTISETYQSKNLIIEIKPLPELLSIYADQNLIELVLINILKNSIEAKATKIKLNAYTQNTQTIIEVQDNGNGIESSMLNRVFLPFYTSKKDGSGIGLSLARQIMFSHGGNIELESITGKTVVKLFFKNNNS